MSHRRPPPLRAPRRRLECAIAHLKRWLAGRMPAYLERKRRRSADAIATFLRDHKNGKMNQVRATKRVVHIKVNGP